MIKVLLVDDHHLIRAGMRSLLDSIEGIEVVAEASNGEEALLLLKKHKIDVAVLDVNMPGLPVSELIQRFLSSSPPIYSVVLTVSNDEALSMELLNLGALSFLNKSTNSEELILAIQKASSNERYLSPEIARRLTYKALQSHSGYEISNSPFSELSQREMQCLKLLAQGKTVKEVAQILVINPKTINTYRYRIYQKLDVENDIDLIKLVARHRLFEQQAH